MTTQESGMPALNELADSLLLHERLAKVLGKHALLPNVLPDMQFGGVGRVIKGPSEGQDYQINALGGPSTAEDSLHRMIVVNFLSAVPDALSRIKNKGTVTLHLLPDRVSIGAQGFAEGATTPLEKLGIIKPLGSWLLSAAQISTQYEDGFYVRKRSLEEDPEGKLRLAEWYAEDRIEEMLGSPIAPPQHPSIRDVNPLVNFFRDQANDTQFFNFHFDAHSRVADGLIVATIDNFNLTTGDVSTIISR